MSETWKKPLSELYVLWDQFSEVRVDDEDRIEVDFLDFEAGDYREEIWHWFEAQNDQFIVGDVLQGIRPDERQSAPESVMNPQETFSEWLQKIKAGDEVIFSDGVELSIRKVARVTPAQVFVNVGRIKDYEQAFRKRDGCMVGGNDSWRRSTISMPTPALVISIREREELKGLRSWLTDSNFSFEQLRAMKVACDECTAKVALGRDGADSAVSGYVLAFPGASDAEGEELVESLRAAGNNVHRVPAATAATALREVAAAERNAPGFEA